MNGSHAPATVSLAHRPDIQSLRALAVGLVVAAHARVPWLAGGFVGVDVFFVLSGYLISGLILRDVELNGRFGAASFYARRLKRLLPALLLVIVTAGAVGSIATSPQQQISDAAAGQAAAVWLSNFYYATRSVDYFASSAQGILFLHTWSLSVEEQFYLVWPWILLFCYGYWAWQGAPRSRRRLLAGLAVVGGLSLLLGLVWAKDDLASGFYLMPGRAWQFALGALTLLLQHRLESGRCAGLEALRGRSLINSTGIALIAVAAVTYGEHLRYPGAWALLPCLGTVLVLLDAPAKRPETMLSWLLLEQRQLRFVGDISYSLYLWHWPVLLLGTRIFGATPTVRAALVALAVALAAATYRFVENPIHRAPLASPRRVFVASAVAIVATVGGGIHWERRAGDRLRRPELAALQAARFDLPELYSGHCDTWIHSAAVTPCVFGPADAKHTVVLFGDSALAQWLPAAQETFLHRPGWRVVVLTKSACPASRVSYYYDRIKARFDVCDRWRDDAVEQIGRMRPDLVILGSRTYPFSDEEWRLGTRGVVETLASAAGALAILNPTPDPGFDGPDCLAAEIAIPAWMPHHRSCRAAFDQQPLDRLRHTLEESIRGLPNAAVIDLGAAVCPDGACQGRIDGTIVFRDNQHLTATFVRTLAPALEGALREKRLLLDVDRN